MKYRFYPVQKDERNSVPANFRFVGFAKKHGYEYLLMDNVFEAWEEYFDPSERLPQPVWAWWVLRGDGVTDDSRALREMVDRAGREKSLSGGGK